MVRRVGEVVLSILGMLCFVGTVFFWMFSNTILNMEDFRSEFIYQMSVESPEINTQDLLNGMDVFGNFLWGFIIFALLSITAGIIACFLVKGNKHPVAAGVTLMITAVLGTILTSFVGFLGGIFYLIAGIMCIARKEKPQAGVQTNETIEQTGSPE